MVFPGVLCPGREGRECVAAAPLLGSEDESPGHRRRVTGREILRLVEASGCPADFVLLEEGNSRINVKLREADGQETAFNGEGPQIPPQGVQQLLAKLGSLTAEDVLVLSGSLPKGLPSTAFPQILEAARRSGARTRSRVGTPCWQRCPTTPSSSNPTTRSCASCLGWKAPSRPWRRKSMPSRLQHMGARNVVVSLGAKGALLAQEGGPCLFCHSVRGEAVSTVGAGDSLVAGFLYGLGLHGTLEGGLKWGVAAGAATAFREGIATGTR